MRDFQELGSVLRDFAVVLPSPGTEAKNIDDFLAHNTKMVLTLGLRRSLKKPEITPIFFIVAGILFSHSRLEGFSELQW